MECSSSLLEGFALPCTSGCVYAFALSPPGIQVLSWPCCPLLSQVTRAGALLGAGEVQGNQNLWQSLSGLPGAGVMQLVSVPWHVPGMG